MVRKLSALSLALGVVACGSGNGGAGPDLGLGLDPLDAIATVSVSPSSATVEVGATTQLSATVTNGHGNIVNTSPTWSTASRDWVQTSYGTKILKAQEYRDRYGTPAIVSERHWVAHL